MVQCNKPYPHHGAPRGTFSTVIDLRLDLLATLVSVVDGDGAVPYFIMLKIAEHISSAPCRPVDHFEQGPFRPP
jgi:hypothetical protein